jgi:hypothetical protein
MVLFAGGKGSSTILQSAEILQYNPDTDTYSIANFNSDMMTSPRAGHTSTYLCNGTILFVGGTMDMVNTLNTIELFRPGLM